MHFRVLEESREKGDASALKNHWNTLQRNGSSESPLTLASDMYSGDNAIELQNANINGSAIVDVSSNKLPENDVNENEELRDRCATFTGTVRLHKNEDSLIDLLKEKKSSQTMESRMGEAPGEAGGKMMTFARTGEPPKSATDKPERPLFQIEANSDKNSTDNEGSDEENLPDPSLLPDPIIDDDETDAPSTGEAVVAPTKAGATEIGIENPSLQLESDGDGAKRLSEYYC